MKELVLKNYSKVVDNNMIYLFIKRLFDIIIGIVGIIAILPLAIIIKISYLLHKDTHSIFYTQDRIGKNGKLFKLYKFRSMVSNADELLENTLKLNKILEEEYRINKKLSDDPRITKIGKILRKTSLDEVPQFINIFLGDMSLIGNRPYMTQEKKDMGIYYDNIIKTKPGLTGYWQVNGRSNTTFKERLKLEDYYSNNFSINLDIKILLKTIKTVILKKGAK